MTTPPQAQPNGEMPTGLLRCNTENCPCGNRSAVNAVEVYERTIGNCGINSVGFVVYCEACKRRGAVCDNLVLAIIDWNDGLV